MITADGSQQAVYNKVDFDDEPVMPAVDKDGNEVIVEVQLPERIVYARVYKFNVGRVELYMLDTDIHPNAPADRELGSRLYGGDQEMRVAQEMMLGVGGIRALRALDIDPSVYHLNEGHAAFLVLELARERVAKGELFAQALKRGCGPHGLYHAYPRGGGQRCVRLRPDGQVLPRLLPPVGRDPRRVPQPCQRGPALGTCLQHDCCLP